MDETKFNEIQIALHAGEKVKDIAAVYKVSETIVKRVRAAKIWDRWPYVVAKAHYGYQTPEYYDYLKRRHLPKTPPKIPTPEELAREFSETTVVVKKRGLLARLFGRG